VFGDFSGFVKMHIQFLIGDDQAAEDDCMGYEQTGNSLFLSLI